MDPIASAAPRPIAAKGLLIDLDGVLYVGQTPIEGAAESLARLRAGGLALRFATNTSTLSLASLHRKLLGLGLDIDASEIISAPQAARLYLERLGRPRCALLLTGDVKSDFAAVEEVDIESADYLVLGDIGPAWDHGLLNRLFKRLMLGAKLIAIHRNRFWQTEAGLCMDIGGLVAALEYCTGQSALVMGKPAADFFRVALREMSLAADEVAMVGDDIDADVGGGQAAGLAGILVRTGKYREAYARASAVRPDAVVDSVRELPGFLGL
ncbi:HAD-superfamily subfamily IIA hydrolase, TIGR01458 [Methylomagnum ishizawai]|uniref:Haloacid dehalogenase-like hydrolase domain-containing protein 2 n=1 Tax=Methylomagnum ishizawai TaxID=1760988 RepID=A0A1Y6CRX7_9GAMM|nr:TIGR01458 family HAD-type hydrolase [Methylomagnum ishizawai]SMF93378.1 HAD-superfamily subfamily IIA hydrolase, TIGR01458 [Methylomagnum ishizawai]